MARKFSARSCAYRLIAATACLLPTCFPLSTRAAFGLPSRTPRALAVACISAFVPPCGRCVDVLHALRQRHFKPAFAAILSAEHLAIARRDVDLLGVAVMQTDRHQRAVRRHPVEALPSLADVLAPVQRAVFR